MSNTNSDDTNKQFRDADTNRYQKLDFITGFEIHRSNNPDIKCELCERLKGKYPKTFIWTGWHDGCKCFSTSILEDPDEFNTDELNKLKSALHGTEYHKKPSRNNIQAVPLGFIYWFADNLSSMRESNIFPDFVRNNIYLINESIDFYKK